MTNYKIDPITPRTRAAAATTTVRNMAQNRKYPMAPMTHAPLSDCGLLIPEGYTAAAGNANS